MAAAAPRARHRAAASRLRAARGGRPQRARGRRCPAAAAAEGFALDAADLAAPPVAVSGGVPAAPDAAEAQEGAAARAAAAVPAEKVDMRTYKLSEESVEVIEGVPNSAGGLAVQGGLVFGFLLLLATTAGVAYLNYQSWQDEREIKKMNEQMAFDDAIDGAGLKARSRDEARSQGRTLSKKGRGFSK